MVRFIRKLQHGVTRGGADIYSIAIAPQIAVELGLPKGGQVAIEVRAVKRGVSEIVLSAVMGL
ncbi:MAG: hypothetical protein A4E48_00800 [Methanosaeta sp. PtaU1.Bin060]|nr:MAG: hypothetical protein A4E48_00800 [Methanosaeta sp. PtaU1.Bin060]